MSDILFLLLPFWTTFNPPLGIATLKGFLQKKGYRVSTIDMNLIPVFWSLYNKYILAVQQLIPNDKKANFKNSVQHLIKFHLTAFIYKTEKEEYIESIERLFQWYYFCKIQEHEIKILDQILEEYTIELKKSIDSIMGTHKPSIVGLSIYTTNFPSSLFACKTIRNGNPDVKIIAGGGIFSNQLIPGSDDFNSFLEITKNYIDHVFFGESENLMLEYLNQNLPLKKYYTLKDINNKLVDLDKEEYPDYNNEDINKYLWMIISGSRSCIYQCAFCSETVYWGKYRKKSIENIINDIKNLYNSYKNNLFIFSDSLLNPIIDDFAKQVMKLDYPIYYDGYLKVDKKTIKPGNAKFWAKSGFYRARLGIESGSQKILEKINKLINVEQIKISIRNLASAGIQNTVYIIVGFPDETEDDFKQTLELIEELKDDIYELEYNPFYVYPDGQVNSETWKEKEGITPVFPPNLNKLFITNKWELKSAPSREVVFDRMCRLSDLLSKLNIPTIYTYIDIFKADKRWKKLHPNKVLAITDLVGHRSEVTI